MADSIEFTRKRVADLKAKLRAREGQPGYTKNVEEIKAELARLEAVLEKSE